MFTVSRLHHLLGHKDSIYTLANLPQPKQFISAAADGYVVIWDLENIAENQDVIGKVIAKIANSVYALCVIPEKNYVVVGHNLDGIHIIDLANNQEIFSAGFTKSAIFDIKNIGNDVWVACGDGNIFVIDLQTFSLKKTLTYSQQAARTLAVSAQKNEIAVGYSDNCIRIFNSQTFELKKEFLAHTNSVFSLCYSPNDDFLLSGSRDAHLKIWSVSQDYTLHQDIVAHLFTINHIAYSPDNQYFATCSKDKSIKLWQAENFKLVKVIDRGRYAGHGTSINKLIWLNSKTLVSCSDDRTMVVWEIKL